MPTDISKIISDAAYQAYERRLLHQVRQAAIPQHVAIIMDGNRRFAREIGLGNVLDGHVKGRDKLEEVLEWCLEVGDAQAGKVDAHDIDEKFFSKRLYTADLPDPDLVLRTSGEERISNFLLWQLAYSELYFVDVYWPGFRKIDFLRALRSYQMRQRRYGE